MVRQNRRKLAYDSKRTHVSFCYPLAICLLSICHLLSAILLRSHPSIGSVRIKKVKLMKILTKNILAFGRLFWETLYEKAIYNWDKGKKQTNL